jgi:hypothetical protein
MAKAWMLLLQHSLHWNPCPFEAYQWLVFDIKRGKADQILSFSAAYSQRANMAK